MTTHERSEKKLALADVFSFSSGSMISSGLFVLPAIVFASLGPSVVTVYLLASIMVIPSMLAKAELATAMPKSGGTYFFVERSLGSLLGSFAGFAGWFSIALKGAFALVGIGAFWTYVNPNATVTSIKIVALCFVLIFTIINLAGIHSSAKSQVLMVGILLILLIAYILLGATKARFLSMKSYIPDDFSGLLPAAGMVLVSFGGLTKVAAVAHKVKKPGKNIPWGMFLSFIVVIIIYILSIAVTVGLLSSETLATTLTPLSEGGQIIAGDAGGIILAIAALIAFATTANASILSASQNPAAMARDGLLPAWIGRMNSKKTVPVPAVILTGLFMALVILALDIENLVKVASTMMLILFLMVNLSLILMRESRIVSYRPTYRVPLYPVLPIVGILLSGMVIYTMGTMPLLITAGFFVLTTIWTVFYQPSRPKRDSALLRIVERVVAREIRGTRLSEELGEILMERDGVNNEDRFDQLIRKAIILDLAGEITREKLFKKLAGAFSLRLEVGYESILEKLNEREKESTTQLSDNLAIPHIVLSNERGFEMVLVRVRDGVVYDENHSKPKIVFGLAGDRSERNFHLQCLMAIAQITQTTDFQNHWMEAFDEEELRMLVLLSERSR